jgi:hypothetical protein
MENKTIYTLEIDRGIVSERFKPLQYYINEHGCFECISHSKNEKGYISMKINNKQTKIHRHIYESLIGKIPKGLIIMHKCDNPACLNVDHYQVGTIKENNDDMHSKNRNTKRVYLSIELKREMVENKDNLKNQDLCDKYNVGHTTLKDTRKAFKEGRLK